MLTETGGFLRFEVMKGIKAGIIYFIIVFGAGFILGPIRILWLVPRIGVRYAELAEMPVMLAVIIISSRWVVRNFHVPSSRVIRLGMGGVALALLLIAEFGLVLRLRGMTVREYFATIDPVSGTVLYLLQGFMAVMPLLTAPFPLRKP